MKGAPQYDAASMIWQARANLPDEWKTRLLEDYMTSFESVLGQRWTGRCSAAIQWLCADTLAAGAGCLWLPWLV
jgi:hypothetical protein